MPADVRLITAQGRLGPLYQAEFELNGQTYRSNYWPTEGQALEQADMKRRSLERPMGPLGSITKLSVMRLTELQAMARELGVREIRGKRKWDLIRAMQKVTEEQDSGQKIPG